MTVTFCATLRMSTQETHLVKVNREDIEKENIFQLLYFNSCFPNFDFHALFFSWGFEVFYIWVTNHEASKNNPEFLVLSQSICRVTTLGRTELNYIYHFSHVMMDALPGYYLLSWSYSNSCDFSSSHCSRV